MTSDQVQDNGMAASARDCSPGRAPGGAAATQTRCLSETGDQSRAARLRAMLLLVALLSFAAVAATSALGF